MATHFARGILTEGQLVSIRLSSSCHIEPETCLLTDERVFSPPEAFLPN